MGRSNKLIFYTEVLTKLNVISEQDKEAILKKEKKRVE